MITVMHLADVINRGDFIDMVVRGAHPQRFRMVACSFTDQSNIAPPDYAAVGIPHRVLNLTQRRHTFRAAVHLARILRTEQIRILHAHHYQGAVLGVLATRLVPGVQLILGRHYSDEIYLLPQRLKRLTYVRLEALMNRLATKIVVPSTYIQQMLLESHQLEAGRVTMIPYAFDLTRYTPEQTPASQQIRADLSCNGELLLGSFGRHVPTKGLEYLLQAFASLRQRNAHVRLVLVGDGPGHADLKKMAHQLGLVNAEGKDAVVFTGWQSNRLEYMRAVDMVVHPSLHEAFSSVMVESLLLAKPLIITDVSGATDLIAHGANGLIVPKRDSKALETAMQSLVEQPALREQYAQAGHERAVAYVDMRRVVPQYEALYESVVASSPS